MNKALIAILIVLNMILSVACARETIIAEETSVLTMDTVLSGDPVLSDERDYDRVCLQLQPNYLISAGNQCKYYIPADQQLWQDLLESTLEKADYNSHWMEGDSASGIWILYRDEEWQILAGGELQTAEYGRVDAQDAKQIYDLSMDALQMLGLPQPVRLTDIENIRSAMLNYQGVHTVTDSQRLQMLEGWLKDSKEMRGAWNCPLDAVLTLELESGAVLDLLIATDSCCVWASEGVFYQYGLTDNREFLAFFTEE